MDARAREDAQVPAVWVLVAGEAEFGRVNCRPGIREAVGVDDPQELVFTGSDRSVTLENDAPLSPFFRIDCELKIELLEGR